jgi:nitrite reductase (NO-forming)
MRKLTFGLVSGIMGAAILLASCGGGSEQKAQAPATTVQKEEPKAANPMAVQKARGEELYKTKCIACHQANGQGLPNAFPSLVGSEFLLKNTKLAASQVLNGSAHVAADRKVKWPAPMPPQVDTKEDAVAVINYVLNSFGNTGGFISVDDIKEIEILPRQ